MKKEMIKLKNQYQKEWNQKEKESVLLSRGRVIFFLLFLILVFGYSSYSSIIVLLSSLLSLIIFFILVFYHNHIEKEKNILENYISIIEKYEERNEENWKSEKNENYSLEEYFLSDLDIIGNNSLLSFVDFTNSLGGKRKLVEILSLKEVNEKTILENQEVMKELKNNFSFALDFSEKLSRIKNIQKIDFEEYLSFFDRKSGGKKGEVLISIFFSILTIVTFLLSIFKIIPMGYFLGLFLFQLAASHFYTSIYREEMDAIANQARIFGCLKETYDFIEKQNFTASKSRKLQNDIIKGKDILERLRKISDLNEYRYNIITNILFNVFFSLNFVLLYLYSELLHKESKNFKNSIFAIEELEVLISLATISFVKEDVCIPTITKEISLSLKDMKHPLLEETKCISNSFQCKQDIQIITGSNMSGKTSFMRTIGINLVLAYTGAYVNAKEFTCPIFKIFTSINVKDDISNGISTFYGELQRIKTVLDFSKNKKMPMIIFIDEIFKGTNYNDRILGAKEVLKKLSNLSCIVFLTTHDFELCEINNKKIHNYHFEETYKKNKISFDYKIKEGQCKTTNAKYLMEQIGIID